MIRRDGDTRVVCRTATDTTMMAKRRWARFYAIEAPPYGGDTLFATVPRLHALSDG